MKLLPGENYPDACDWNQCNRREVDLDQHVQPSGDAKDVAFATIFGAARSKAVLPRIKRVE